MNMMIVYELERNKKGEKSEVKKDKKR